MACARKINKLSDKQETDQIIEQLVSYFLNAIKSERFAG